MTRTYKTSIVTALALAVAFLVQGCSSGDGNADVISINPVLQGSFTADITQISPAPGAPFVSLDSGGSPSSEVLRLEVNAVGVTDLWAVAFTLEFDPALLEYVDDSAANGGFLGSDADVEVLAAPELGRRDRLVVSAAKLRRDPSDLGVNGTGTVMTLDFQLLGRGDTRLDYAPAPANTAALDSNDQVIFGILRFYGGDVQIQ